tara:strand:- start:337 stop:1128 length:792 start_codon:yes stop_codon:yes gene_type:complete
MEKSLSFKNTKISYTESGKGSVIVLLHGFLENKTMWEEIIPEISNTNRVLSIDLLGHGQTDCLGYIHSMEMMADVVFAVLKSLKIRRITLIGHSLGGYVSLAFAEKHPKMIKGLCLMNSTSSADDEKRKKLRTRANKMVQNNFNNMVRMSFINLFEKESRTRFKPKMNLALKEALKTSLQGYIAGQEGMRVRPNRSSVLKDNLFQKLIIIGKNDPVLVYEESIKEAEKTNTEIVIFKNGHMSHIENKEELLNTLKGFIKKCKK